MVCGLAAPLSWTITVSWVGLRLSALDIACTVEPQATPTVMPEEIRVLSTWAACEETRSRISLSLSDPSVGTTNTWSP